LDKLNFKFKLKKSFMQVRILHLALQKFYAGLAELADADAFERWELLNSDYSKKLKTSVEFISNCQYQSVAVAGSSPVSRSKNYARVAQW
jgi:hypothetical protein